MAATQKGSQKSKQPEDESDSDEPCDDDDPEVAKVSKVDKMKQELQELNTLETKLEDRLEYLENEHYEQKIAQETIPVSNETVPALAKMLGNMRTEMHEFITPFYNEELEDRLEDIEEEQIQLKKDIAEAEGGNVEAQEVKEEKVEKVKKEKEEEEEEEEKEPEPKAEPRAEKKEQEDLWHTGTKVLIAVMVLIVLFIVATFVVKRRQG